jgi:hypothetical protein
MGADEVSRESWQLVTAIHIYNGYGLTLCERFCIATSAIIILLNVL